MKKLLSVALILCLCLTLCACGKSASIGVIGGSDGPTSIFVTQDSATVISLEGQSASVKGGGVKVQDGTVTITSPGEYLLQGELEGQVVVNTGEDKLQVTVYLDNAVIKNPNGPALLVERAKDLQLCTVSGSSNRLISGAEGQLLPAAEDASGAAVYAEDDMELCGEGSLSIEGYLNSGLVCKDDLLISGGSIDVRAANNGLRGSESVTVTGGDIAVLSLNDAVKTTSAEKAGKGNISISGGSLLLRSQGDGLSAESDISISGGAVNVETSVGEEGASRVCVKAAGKVEVSGGTLGLMSEDDRGIQADGDVSISGGSLSIITARDGIKTGDADTASGILSVSGGDCYVCSGDDAVDAGAEIKLLSGSLKAIGGAKKIKSPITASAPYCTGEVTVLEGNAFILTDDAGTELVRVERTGGVKTALIFMPELKAGESYSVITGESAQNQWAAGTLTAK